MTKTNLRESALSDIAAAIEFVKHYERHGDGRGMNQALTAMAFCEDIADMGKLFNVLSKKDHKRATNSINRRWRALFLFNARNQATTRRESGDVHDYT